MAMSRWGSKCNLVILPKLFRQEFGTVSAERIGGVLTMLEILPATLDFTNLLIGRVTRGQASALPIYRYGHISFIEVRVGMAGKIGSVPVEHRREKKFESSRRQECLRSYNSARNFVHRLKLSTQREWQAYCQSGKLPSDIPADPRRVFAKDGWAGMADWLGNGKADKQRSVRALQGTPRRNRPIEASV